MPPVAARVLFVCLGNSCRSQMAEGFARAYGSDVMAAQSAGLMPASLVSPLTRQVMAEKNISLEERYPKPYDGFKAADLDLIVNMSGFTLPATTVAVREWDVQDPMGESDQVYREVRDQIETLVMRLILDLRQRAPEPPRQRSRPRLRGI